MLHRRTGTSLCEVLLALVLISTTASWALQSAAVTERAIGHTRARRAALHRATLALAELQTVPCDSNVSRVNIEARWQILSARARSGRLLRDQVTIHSRRGDTIALHRNAWCDR